MHKTGECHGAGGGWGMVLKLVAARIKSTAALDIVAAGTNHKRFTLKEHSNVSLWCHDVMTIDGTNVHVEAP